MTENEIKTAIREIGIALNMVHNCVVTDNVDAEPDDLSWRINHDTEIDMLDALEKVLLANMNTCP